jgi:hypothetical protein
MQIILLAKIQKYRKEPLTSTTYLVIPKKVDTFVAVLPYQRMKDEEI